MPTRLLLQIQCFTQLQSLDFFIDWFLINSAFLLCSSAHTDTMKCVHAFNVIIIIFFFFNLIAFSNLVQLLLNFSSESRFRPQGKFLVSSFWGVEWLLPVLPEEQIIQRCTAANVGWRATEWRERLRSLYQLHHSSAKSLRTQGIRDGPRSSVTRSFPSLYSLFVCVWHHRLPISVLGLSIPSCCLLYVPAKLLKSSMKTNYLWLAGVPLLLWLNEPCPECTENTDTRSEKGFLFLTIPHVATRSSTASLQFIPAVTAG